MNSALVIRSIAGGLGLSVLAAALVYIAFLGGVLRKCSPSSRTMQPAMVWLLLIPLVNLVWSFLVVNALADTLGSELKERSLPVSDPKPGRSVGIAMAVCGACSFIPFVNFLAFPVHFILWIVYWVEIAGFSRQLDSSIVPGFAPVAAQQN